MTGKSNKPSYLEMFCEAIEQLGEKKGSSRHAVVQYMVENHDLTEGNALNTHLKRAIESAIKENKIEEISGRSGLLGKWKLAKTKSKTTSKSSVKTSSASPKKPAKKTTSTSKKAAPKSPKAAPKSPKAAKSPKKKTSGSKSPKSKTASKKKSA